jgi:hypothetical protein
MTASLDLTHVLCATFHFILNFGLTGFLDDESSIISLALALITLSPILLMV